MRKGRTMQKWEYKTILGNRGWEKYQKDAHTEEDFCWGALTDGMAQTTDADGKTGTQAEQDLGALLEALGNDGWELVAVVPRPSALGLVGAADYAGFTNQELWVFKRPKQ